MYYGYIRFFKSDEEREELKRKLQRLCVDKVLVENTKNMNRLGKIMSSVTKYDVICCEQFEDLGSSLSEIANNLEIILERKATVKILKTKQTLTLCKDSEHRSSTITFMDHFRIASDVHSRLLGSRIKDGKTKAKEKSLFKDGRPPKYTREHLKKAVNLLEKESFKEVSKKTGISESTLYRAKKKFDEESSQQSVQLQNYIDVADLL